ncbi:MAG TPA: membrane protein insertion efficiency factor YidD [Chitinivibrionales bacterium]|nr:membrane protein insertion efficiency factor YidD [Chitinivibrionales bacterium]
METFCRKIGQYALSFLVILTKSVLIVPRGSCRFSPSCSEYALQAIKTMPLHRALAAIACRVIRCTPLSPGGYDPVQTQHRKGMFS